MLTASIAFYYWNSQYYMQVITAENQNCIVLPITGKQYDEMNRNEASAIYYENPFEPGNQINL